ncbi:MAG: RNA polymerase-binding protein DksA [Acinetobacter johnsonii]|nr:MAG: RNA polymerase-binding protein DksA [Acinetobacter johnsonii]
MANDNQNTVLDEQTDVVDEKSTKRVRKTKPKATDGGSTASLFGIEPYQPKKNEEYMSDEQLAHFKAILLDWKHQLIGEADRTKTYIQDESSAMPDINDRATQEEEFALTLRTRDRERKLIRKIDKSIAEIENEDYGFCETCGVEIGLRRLEARPTATQCIDCKTLSEIKERQNQGA